MIEICKWNETFESAHTRKRQRLKCFLSPSGIESRGLLNLLSRWEEADALAAFGVFQLLCQLSATLPSSHRGKLIHSDGKAMVLEHVSSLVRVSVPSLIDALVILSDPRVGWIHAHGSIAEAIRERMPVTEDAPEAPAPAPAPRPPKATQAPVRHEDSQGTDLRDRLPTSQAEEHETIQRRINAMSPNWRRAYSYSENQTYLANSKVFVGLTENEWNVLHAYMHAIIPDEWAADRFWQPDVRSRFLEQIADVITHSERWARKCKKEGVTIPLTPVEC